MKIIAGVKRPFLSGEKIYLRGLLESDADGPYPEWLNDPAVCEGNSHRVWPYGREAALAYIRRVQEARDQLVLAVVSNNGDRHIGNIALQAVHPVYRSAELSILIGDPGSWGMGIGTEAARLIVGHGFSALNLERVACGTFATNTSMIALAKRLGMKQEGVRRKAAWKDGQWLDVVEFGILRDEFKP